MFFQVYCFKNVGVAGYVEAFEMVQLEKQASYMGYLFRNRCTSFLLSELATKKLEAKHLRILYLQLFYTLKCFFRVFLPCFFKNDSNQIFLKPSIFTICSFYQVFNWVLFYTKLNHHSIHNFLYIQRQDPFQSKWLKLHFSF